jgi:hypothetical protein
MVHAGKATFGFRKNLATFGKNRSVARSLLSEPAPETFAFARKS